MNTEPQRLKNGVIALLDALGTTTLWAEPELAEVIKAWNDVVLTFKKASKRIAQDCDYYVLAFSDTIIIILLGERKDLVCLIGDILLSPFIQALRKGMFLRGVISTGKILYTPTLITGPAVYEAATSFEQPEWIGISTTPSATYTLNALDINGEDVRNRFIRWRIPLKGERYEEAWALAWPTKVAKDEAFLFRQFSKRPPLDPGVKKKYENTLEFFETVTKRIQVKIDKLPLRREKVERASSEDKLFISLDSLFDRVIGDWKANPQKVIDLLRLLEKPYYESEQEGKR